MNTKKHQRHAFVAESKQKEAEQDRADLEQAYKALENTYETLKEKYDNSTIHLRLLVENEKESRDTWKEKFSEEMTNKTFLNKSVFNLKSEL